MKLDKLWVSEFKNLKNITIDFDQNELVTVIIGWNGAGKSNVIEALVIIFRDLDLHYPPAFSYDLEYVCRGRKIYIEARVNDDKKDRYKIKCHPINKPNESKNLSNKEFFEDEDKKYLPTNVFGYYSGPSDRLATHFYEHQRRFREQLIYPEKFNLNENTLPLRPLFYAQKVHSNFVLLAFFLSEDEKIKNFLKEKLFIDGLESVMFVISKPDWKSSEGDPRFWNAKGVVQPFLERLYEASLAPMDIKFTLPHPLKKNGENVDALFLFLKDLDALKNVGNHTSDKDFFKLLESIYFSSLIHEVQIRVKVNEKNGTNELLTFRELSEGEQQLITVLGLLRFTRDDESLFLLDEPDTHLNPAWSMEYINYLEEVAGFNLDRKESQQNDGSKQKIENSHIVLATHDPVVISTLKREQIQIMKRDENTLEVYAHSPLYDPKGMGFSGVLMSDMFGLRSDLDPKTLEKLDEHAILLANENRTAEEEVRFGELKEELDMLGFLEAYSDPYFSAFVKAWGRSERIDQYHQVSLTESTRDELSKMSDDILSELKREEGN
ncbi:AAA family ATPase [Citrobacter sp. Cf084]|nr:AAA family ATPase [Citrobacter sp. Cf084]EKT9263148.1 AAA family ATPase [Citrobacter freundii]EKW0765648.1 AAA family ATPase [Citrobacter freundii]MDM3219633.1 ATP-binding protein [Citrobacter sp. Cf084]HCL6565442.1 AAA family ATPase [Citrobacter freundii]